MLYECEIKFKDEECSFISIIKDSVDVLEDEDDSIFYYCNSEKEIKSLMEEDNGQDFVVLSYEPIN